MIKSWLKFRTHSITLWMVLSQKGLLYCIMRHIIPGFLSLYLICRYTSLSTIWPIFSVLTMLTAMYTCKCISAQYWFNSALCTKHALLIVIVVIRHQCIQDHTWPFISIYVGTIKLGIWQYLYSEISKMNRVVKSKFVLWTKYDAPGINIYDLRNGFQNVNHLMAKTDTVW